MADPNASSPTEHDALVGQTSVSSSTSQRCAVISREQGVDPIGSAGSYDVFILVEQPLPWPRDISERSLLRQIATWAQASAPESKIRVQAILNEETSDSDRKIVVYRRPPGPFTAYRNLEAQSPPGDLPQAVSELLGALNSEGLTERPGSPLTDLLVCTHGTRDRCCGSLGTRLWRTIPKSRDVRTWRTSHTGGHRFAPTALVLPTGQYWAFLDDTTLDAVINRSQPPSQLAMHYRGCAAFDSPAAQAAERAAFVRVGWDWLSWSRWKEDLGNGAIRIHFVDPDRGHGTYDVLTARGRRVSNPACGESVESLGAPSFETKVVRCEQTS